MQGPYSYDLTPAYISRVKRARERSDLQVKHPKDVVYHGLSLSVHYKSAVSSPALLRIYHNKLTRL